MVRGLTTFINKRSHMFMEKYALHDTPLILDGDSISSSLYDFYFQPKNCCFTGDVDRYANLIKNFFSSLLECNITPYIIYAGGYNNKKVESITRRMQNKLDITIKCSPVSEDIVHPQGMSETFKNVAQEFNIKVICCDNEFDLECVKIANYWKCPVMSYNSDFYIFDVLYIPFNTLNLRPIRCLRTINNEKRLYQYLSCEMFNREKFLKTLDLEPDMLPLFAILLGTDYIPRETFHCLYQQFNHNAIYSVAAFILNKTKEEVVQEISIICNFIDDDGIIEKIHTSINDYMITNEECSKYIRYLNLENLHTGRDTMVDRNDIDTYVKSTGAPPEMISLFIDNFRKCLYPSYFITILFYNRYHIRPQVEDINKPSAHLIALELISAIHKILRPSSEQLDFYTRSNLQHTKHLVPPCTVPVPSFIDIKNIDVNSRKKILLQVTGMDENFVENCLNCFPDSWKLFVIVVNYICNKSNFTWSLLQALLLCKIINDYVDTKLEKFFRNSKLFYDNYKDEICQNLIKENVSSDLQHTIQESINDITYEDSLMTLKNVIHFFEIESELTRNVQLFDRSLTHAIAEFKTCLSHTNNLNSLLNLPFEKCKMSSCFNGTFLYNITCDIRKNCSENYIQNVLKESPTILNCFILMAETLKKYIKLNN